MSEGTPVSNSKTVFVAGASGTIGRAAVRACLADGHRVLAQLRTAPAKPIAELDGAEIVTADLSHEGAIRRLLGQHKPDTIISCIASRSGSPKDALAVDYKANSALLKEAVEAGVEHFILLSAICVQRPKLAFQRAKLAFEHELIEGPIAHTIIRPTAFFKSLSGQVEKVARGKPFMMFGDGELTRCKPISDADLGRFIALSVSDPERRGKILPIGGPGPAISALDQHEMLEAILGKSVPVKHVSPALLDRIGSVFTFLHSFSPLARDWLAEKAEYMRIAKYYATESMLLLDPETGEYSEELTPEFGADHLSDHYVDLIKSAQ